MLIDLSQYSRHLVSEKIYSADVSTHKIINNFISYFKWSGNYVQHNKVSKVKSLENKRALLFTQGLFLESSIIPSQHKPS